LYLLINIPKLILVFSLVMELIMNNTPREERMIWRINEEIRIAEFMLKNWDTCDDNNNFKKKWESKDNVIYYIECSKELLEELER